MSSSRRSVAVVTESTAIVPRHLVEELDIGVAPLTVSINDQPYRDGIDIDADTFYRLLPTLETLPTTSQPSPGAFYERFAAALARYDHVVCITISGGLSGTYESARIAARMIAEERGLTLAAGDERAVDALAPVTVIDSRTVAQPLGIIVVEAAKLARSGADPSQVAARARELVSRIGFLGMVDTVEYLVKGGHVPKVAGMATRALGLKPMIKFENGEVLPAGIARNVRQGLHRMVDLLVHDALGKKHVVAWVAHADAADRAQELEDLIHDHFPALVIERVGFTPVMGTHTGPGLVGLGFLAE